MLVSRDSGSSSPKYNLSPTWRGPRFLNFSRSYSCCIQPWKHGSSQLEPTLWNSPDRQRIANDFSISASWWRSARPELVDKTHSWELKILLLLKEDENLMLLECEFTNLHIFLNFKFHYPYPVEYKTQGYLTVNFKHPLGFIIHTPAASFD